MKDTTFYIYNIIQNTTCQDHLICGIFGSWISHLMKAELLWGARGIQGSLHLAEESAALQDLLLQSLEVINVAHCVAAMAVGERAVRGLTLQGRGCWEGKQENWE